MRFFLLHHREGFEVWLPMDKSRLLTGVANHITSPLRPTGTGIPIHGSLSYEGPPTRLHDQRNFIAEIGVTGLDQVLPHHGTDLDSKAAMRHHREPLGEYMAVAIH